MAVYLRQPTTIDGKANGAGARIEEGLVLGLINGIALDWKLLGPFPRRRPFAQVGHELRSGDPGQAAEAEPAQHPH